MGTLRGPWGRTPPSITYPAPLEAEAVLFFSRPLIMLLGAVRIAEDGRGAPVPIRRLHTSPAEIVACNLLLLLLSGRSVLHGRLDLLSGSGTIVRRPVVFVYREPLARRSVHLPT